MNNFDVDFFYLANFDSCFAGNYLGNDLVCLALKRKFGNDITKTKFRFKSDTGNIMYCIVKSKA